MEKRDKDTFIVASRTVLVLFEWYEHPKNESQEFLQNFSMHILCKN